MTEIDRSALVLFPADAMFALVADIESYPQFMDGCVGARVLTRSDAEVTAVLELSKGGIRQQFTTRNRLQRPRQITMELVEGPFESFNGEWRFDPLTDNACKVSLHLTFSFSNSVVAGAASRLFHSVANTQVDALCKRARLIYG